MVGNISNAVKSNGAVSPTAPRAAEAGEHMCVMWSRMEHGIDLGTVTGGRMNVDVNGERENIISSSMVTCVEIHAECTRTRTGWTARAKMRR